MGYSGSKRRSRRVKESASVYCKVKEDTEGYYKLSKDISESGIRLVGDKFKPVGSCVRLQILLDRGHNKLIETTGKIVWVKKQDRGENYEFGIMFDSLSCEDKKHLREFVIRKIRF